MERKLSREFEKNMVLIFNMISQLEPQVAEPFLEYPLSSCYCFLLLQSPLEIHTPKFRPAPHNCIPLLLGLRLFLTSQLLDATCHPITCIFCCSHHLARLVSLITTICFYFSNLSLTKEGQIEDHNPFVGQYMEHCKSTRPSIARKPFPSPTSPLFSPASASSHPGTCAAVR